MLGKIYDFIYYRTYLSLSKTNTISSITSSARLLSTTLLINIMTFFFLFEKHFSETGFYIACVLATLGSFYVLNRFNDKKAKIIIREYSEKKINKIWICLIDYYPDLSLLICIISTGANLYTISTTLGIIIVLRGFLFFAEM